jgi:hypothetical protein
MLIPDVRFGKGGGANTVYGTSALHADCGHVPAVVIPQLRAISGRVGALGYIIVAIFLVSRAVSTAIYRPRRWANGDAAWRTGREVDRAQAEEAIAVAAAPAFRIVPRLQDHLSLMAGKDGTICQKIAHPRVWPEGFEPLADEA